MANERQLIGMIGIDQETGRESVFLNSHSAIQYSVAPMMSPKENNVNLTGYMSSFEDEDFEDYEYLDDDKRIERFSEWIRDWLLMFSYRTSAGEEYPKARKIHLIPKPSSVTRDSEFYSIPVFSAADDEMVSEWSKLRGFQFWRDYDDLNDFKQNIREKKSVGRIYSYDLDDFKPSFVIWKDRKGKLFAIGGFVDIDYNSLGGIMIEGDDIVKIDISEYLNFLIYDVNANPTVAFILTSLYKEIEDRILRDVEERNLEGAIENDGVQGEDSVRRDEPPETNGVREIHERSTLALWEINSEDRNDELIIDSMDYYSQRNSLYYSMKDLVNVHTSIKCSNLVVLSGLSGTGKSQLVEIYAKSLGVKTGNSDEDRLLIIPVRPSWNDDADLLGYVDLVHMVYRASDTGFVDLLVNAQKKENENKMYIVCFDEMNLARVEHYFSQFLSVLERPAKNRDLQLYDDQYMGRLYNSKDYPSKIRLGDNIKFIGTVNIDETTYHFSDKVLDRANVIQLDVLNYAEEWKAKPYANLPIIIWSRDEYVNLIRKPSDDSRYIMQLHQLLWDIHQLMQGASSKYGIGPRIVKAIEKYIWNLPEREIDGFNKMVALDYQIVQRVLTKVRGPENQLGGIIKKQSEDNFYKIFEKHSELSNFEHSRKVLEQKEKELEVYGYCV